MRIPKYAAALTAALALSLASLPAVCAEEVPEWPSEQEQHLQEADSSLLDIQRKRFQARLAGDEEAAKRLDRQYKKLQKDRNQLLQATGRR